jgi:hypothetical protein
MFILIQECRYSYTLIETIMKRIILSILAGLTLTAAIQAQTVDDALRYSQVFYSGTARFMSMGGAFTALGGDMSSLSQNPAGIGVFRSSELSLSPQMNYINTTAGFHGATTDYIYNFNLSQAGFVSNIRSGGSDGLLNLNFGYTFNKTNNLHQTAMIQGVSNSSSIADYWAGSNYNTNFHDLTGPAGIAFDTWIIDTITGSGGSAYGTVFNNYGDNINSKYGQTIKRIINNDGFIGEHAISFGGSYADKVYFGATLGISELRYTSQFQHTESADYPLDTKLKDFTYLDYYEDKGTGYSFKMGVIYKPVEALRLGLAFHSPTWYHIDEYFFENINSNFTDGGHYESSNDPLRYNYALATPFRLLAGVGLQIRKTALISADYEFVDYSTARFSQTGDGYDYSAKNEIIRNTLRPSSNFRLGGELRFNKLYLRSGYGYYGRSFKNGDTNSTMNYNSVSGGIGFREGGFSLDLGYTHLNNTKIEILYPVDSSVENASASLTTNQNMFTLTMGLKFGR